MNLLTKKKQTHRPRKQTMVTKEERREGINQEFQINIYISLCIKQINNKNLLYSTGNYIQHSVITFNGKESERINKYMYVQLYTHTHSSHFAVHKKMIQNC